MIFAHGFGERYDLPAPLAYFIAVAALTVGLSFAVAVAMARGTSRGNADGGLVVPLGPLLPALRRLGRVVSVGLLALVIVAGLFGDPHPAKNLAPTFVWIAWWIGLSLAVACVGNVWPALDPWRALFDGCHALARRMRPHGLCLGWTYPRALGAWPAVALLLVFAWLEFVYAQASSPSRIAAMVLAWSLVTLLGMACVGPETWQRNADVFAVYFGVLGRLAPIAMAADRRSLVLRPPGRGLVEQQAVPTGMVAFVIAMLSTVLFDGLLGTRAWRLVDRTLSTWTPALADRDGYVFGTAGLLGVWALLLGAYLATCLVTAALVRERSAAAIASLCVLSLVPIVVAYNVAHNLSVLLAQGPALVPLLSDPLGRGWNLYGATSATPATGLVGVRLTWYVAIGAIVAGHVMSVWLGHCVTLRAFGERRRAAIASVPLTVLMVAYTALSLSVIAEPLVRFRTPDPSYSLRVLVRPFS